MLTAQLSFCQRTYPSKAVIKGDTVVIITLDQAQRVNVAFVQLEERSEMIAHLKSVVDTAARLVDLQRQQIELTHEQLRLKSDIVDQQRYVINNLDQTIASLNKKNTMNKFQRNVLFLVGAFLTIKLLSQ